MISVDSDLASTSGLSTATPIAINGPITLGGNNFTLAGGLTTTLGSGLTVLLLWFALLPYVHSFDAIVLLPLLAVLVAADQRGWGDATTEATVWAFAIIPFAYFVGWHVLFFNGFTAIAMALLLLAWHRRVVMRSPDEIAQARAA